MVKKVHANPMSNVKDGDYFSVMVNAKPNNKRSQEKLVDVF